MTKIVPYLGLFCGYIIVIFLTDSIESRGVSHRKNRNRELGNDSGETQLKRRDERLLSAHIKVSRCRNQGCKVQIETLLRRHRHRHGFGDKDTSPEKHSDNKTPMKENKVRKNRRRKKPPKNHKDNEEKERRISHEEHSGSDIRQRKISNKHLTEEKIERKSHTKPKPEEVIKPISNKKHKVEGEVEQNSNVKHSSGEKKDKQKSQRKRTGKRNKAHKKTKDKDQKTKSRIKPEDVMQIGEDGGNHFAPDLDPENIMQNGEGVPADRYDIASYDQYYAGYGRRRFGRLQRPPEADRLERRLNPNIATAAHQMLSSIDRVVLALKSNIQQMHDDYDFAFNSTRYTMMMGVRRELKNIAESNNLVYDVVMDISLLTKDIYMRAHRRGQTRPTTRRGPDMPTFRSLSDALNSTYHAQMQSKKQRNQVEQMFNECQRQESYLKQIQDNFNENINRRALIDLTRQVNMTVRKLRAEFNTAMVVRKLNRYMFVSGGTTQSDVRDATILVDDARRALRQAALNSRGNAIAYEDWHRRRSGDTLAPVSFTDIRSRPHREHSRHKRATITREEKARLRPIINRAVDHARDLRHLADRIGRILHPVLAEANQVITGNGQLSHRVQASLLADKLMTDIHNIRMALDRIRIVIYNENDLKVRCEELAEGSGYDDEASPIDCDDYLKEGSGNVEEVITSSDPDEESDLYFEGANVPETTPDTSASRFGEKLKIHVVNLRKAGDITLVRAQTARNRTSEMSKRWSRVNANLVTGDKFVTGSAEFLTDWNREQPKIDQISEKIKAVHEKVDFVYNITQSKTFQAVLKAEKKVREVRGQNGGGSTTRGSNGGSSNQDFAAAIQASNKAKNTTSAILTFNRKVPSLIAGMDQRMDQIRNKISNLRDKVNKARLVLSSFQVSINKQDEGYLPLALSSSDGSQSMQTSIELCIKPEVADGQVLLVTGNNADSYSLSMSGKKLKLTVYDTDGDDVGYVTSNIDAEAEKWYTVLVRRTGQNVSLSVRPEGEGDADTIGDIMNIAYTQPSPIIAYLGGAPESSPIYVEPTAWKGCVGGLRINGWSVGLLQKSSTGIVPLPCSSHCSPAPAQSSMVFEGDGYVHYPVDIVQLRYPTKSVYFEFRTRQEDAFLITVVKRGFQLRVQLNDGALLIETTTPSESVVLRSQNSKYNDGVFHTLKIVYRNTKTYPEIDGKDGLFSIEDPQPEKIQSPVHGIVIGGMLEEHRNGMGSRFRPLIGCVRKLQINDVTMTMAEVTRAEGVHVGSCSKNNMWLSCVEFVNTSEPISYGTTEEAKTVVIVVTRGSIGPVLQYHKGDKFDAVVSMKRDGIEIYESVEEYNGKLPFKEDDNNSFVVIKIKDDSSTVSFEYLDTQASFSYSGSSGWLFANGDQPPYTLTVGGQEAEPDMPPFHGGIAQLLVGNQYVEMSNYIEDNKLTSCYRHYDPSTTTTSSTPLASRRR